MLDARGLNWKYARSMESRILGIAKTASNLLVHQEELHVSKLLFSTCSKFSNKLRISSIDANL